MTSGRPPADDESDPSRAASEAFQALAGEPRTTVVRTLARDGPCDFSTLSDAADLETSAGFAYHLRQVDGTFVRQRADGAYELTAAGRRAAKAIHSGAFTAGVDLDRISLAEACPLCGDQALGALVVDDVTRIDCSGCDSAVLELSFPPSGYVARDADAVPAAIDAYHRRRIETFGDGLCADCGAPVSSAIEPARVDLDADAATDDECRVQAVFDCTACGTDLRCPVALTVLDHPTVVHFFHDHDLDVRDRPIWNVGPEWAERILSHDPWCVVVQVALDDELLELYLAGDGRVVDHRRWNDFDDDSTATDADASATDETASGERSVAETPETTAGEEATGDGAAA